jgi:superfamily II DNA or RNA helicase
MALFDLTAIRRLVPAETFDKAHASQQAGCVEEVTTSRAGRHIAGTVRGSGGKRYYQDIAITQQRQGGFAIHGDCSCPVGMDCKHVAAVLLQLLAREGREPPASARRPAPAPAAPPPASLPPPAEALPPPLADWLKQLLQAEEDSAEDYPPSVQQRLFYLLRADPDRPGQLQLRPVAVRLRKDGGLGAESPLRLPLPAQRPRYLRPADLPILAELASAAAGQPPTPGLLRRAIATGRARWESTAGPALAEGPPRPGRLAWQEAPPDGQRPMLQPAPGAPAGLLCFPLPEPVYVDPAQGQLGALETGLPPLLLARLLDGPPLPNEHAAAFGRLLREGLPDLPLPAPEVHAAADRLEGRPVPRLRLMTGSLPRDRYGFGYGAAAQAPTRQGLAQLSFRYGPVLVPYRQGPGPDTHVVQQDGRRYHLQRDRLQEDAAAARLGEAGMVHPGHFGIYLSEHGDDFLPRRIPPEPGWMTLLGLVVPELRAAGWEIVTDPDFPFRIMQEEDALEARLEPAGDGIDWLDLHLGVVLDGRHLDLAPVLSQLIAAGEAERPRDDANALVMLALPDGGTIGLPYARLKPILTALADLAPGRSAGTLGVGRHAAADLSLLEENAGLRWEGGDSLRALGRQLREAGGTIPPATLPPGFNASLRPYQAEGLAWLQFLRAAGFGGVLADDMGLGKTVQTLAHLAIEKAEGRLDRPCLILCPTSLVPNWTQEAARFAPSLRVLPLHRGDRAGLLDQLDQHDLVLTSYPLLTRDQAALTAQDWHIVVLDEAQYIKNPLSETRRQAVRLKARQRLCLSGTPLQNHLGELWSLFDFVAPGLLGDARGFRSRYRNPIEKQGDAERQALLNRRLRPFLLRRTKQAVMQDLPPKTEIAEPVELGPAQRAVYDAIRLSMHARVKEAIAQRGLAASGIIILDALLKMRQACCDPRLLPLQEGRTSRAGSAKLDRLMELLPVLLEEGRRVLVFSQFTTMLGLIAEALREARIDFLTLTGDTTDRATPVQRFQAGEVPVFLISLKAGGVGLNLTAADTVIHYDPWWNPAAEDQATDRAHRIGQQKPVFVHRLIALGSIEEKMDQLKERKRALVDAVLDSGDSAALALTEADVDALFDG